VKRRIGVVNDIVRGKCRNPPPDTATATAGAGELIEDLKLAKYLRILKQVAIPHTEKVIQNPNNLEGSLERPCECVP
jgi:hypothetical protein